MLPIKLVNFLFSHHLINQFSKKLSYKIVLYCCFENLSLSLQDLNIKQ